MIQDIDPHIFRNAFVEGVTPSPDDYILFYQEKKLMLWKEGDELLLPQRKIFQKLPKKEIYLFSLDEVNCFLWEEYTEDTSGFIFEEISFFRTFPRKDIAWISIVGHQLMQWYQSNKYCGKCGHSTHPRKDERAIHCPHCDSNVYPVISPAIIVAITHGDKILLASGKNFRQQFYSLVAGYADVGESLEAAVIREVKEEVGIDISNIRYYKSQPWPFSGSMMIGYWAEGDPSQPITMEESEITDAAWFSADNLPNHPLPISIAGEMIGIFRDKFLKSSGKLFPGNS